MTRLVATLKRPLIFFPGIAAAVALAGIAALLLMPAPQAVAAVVAPAAPDALASASTSNQASKPRPRARWIEGRRVIVIGGAEARALELEKTTAAL
jgi:hypothetical protein